MRDFVSTSTSSLVFGTVLGTKQALIKVTETTNKCMEGTAVPEEGCGKE